MLNYSWFMVVNGADTGIKLMKETNTAYIITNPMYSTHNGTGYYCIVSNNEGIAVSNTSTLIGNGCFIPVILLYNDIYCGLTATIYLFSACSC